MYKKKLKSSDISLDNELRIRDVSKNLTYEQVAVLDSNFGGLISVIYDMRKGHLSMYKLIEDYSILLDVDGLGEDFNYLFAIKDCRPGIGRDRYFILNAKYDTDRFYVFRGKEIYPKYDCQNECLTFSTKRL